MVVRPSFVPGLARIRNHLSAPVFIAVARIYRCKPTAGAIVTPAIPNQDRVFDSQRSTTGECFSGVSGDLLLPDNLTRVRISRDQPAIERSGVHIVAKKRDATIVW